MNPQLLKKILEDYRSSLAQILGDRLEAVYLYGSQARGDAKPESDIDVLIVIRGEFDYFSILEQISDIAWQLSLENDVVIAQVITTKEKLEEAASPFLMNVQKDAVLV